MNGRWEILYIQKALLNFEKVNTRLNNSWNCSYLTFHIFADGTTNFAHCYPSFAVSVGVLFRGKPAAASVVLIYPFNIMFPILFV